MEVAHGGASIENEIKIKMAGAEQARALLGEAGYRISRPREFETNHVYDTASADFRRRNQLLRLRQMGSTALLTFKSEDLPGPHKRRQELETTVADGAVLHAIFERMGLRIVFRYEKYRTEYRGPEADQGVITLDETPIGVFLELEGSPEWVDACARRLGYSAQDYILLSYGALYVESCRRAGAAPGDMVFSAPS